MRTKRPAMILSRPVISRVNHVWATDITYIPMKSGFVYLVAIMHWYSRRVLSWGLSNTLDTSFCVEALEEAFERFGQPEIFNTDQGSQFTSEDFTTPLRDRGIAISMDPKGCCLDNVFVERLSRSVKYEEVYLHAYADVAEARAGIRRYLTFYNDERAHQALVATRLSAFYRGLARAAACLRDAVHSSVPNLRVSPSRSPLWLASTSFSRSTTARCGHREETANFI